MTDWSRGGWTGSINNWVRREVREHMRENATARSSRYPLIQSVLRQVFSTSSFLRFVIIYLVFDSVIVGAEIIVAYAAPTLVPAWTSQIGPPAVDIKVFITNIAGYLISAQVGVLGVVSIALALVTLIAQRDASSTDVQVYYHESLSFEIVASSVALLMVLCGQLLWPLQFFVHKLGHGTELQFFKLVLLSIHLAWLLLNFAALAHFISTTFRFVQQSEREALRERYTANIVQPQQMTRTLRQQLYLSASQELLGRINERDDELPQVWFGSDFGSPSEVEEERNFSQSMFLHDVRMIWVRWVVRRWVNRSTSNDKRIAHGQGGLRQEQPLLMFSVNFDHKMNGRARWCLRRGGVPLTAFERLVLRKSFCFRTKNYEG